VNNNKVNYALPTWYKASHIIKARPIQRNTFKPFTPQIGRILCIVMWHRVIRRRVKAGFTIFTLDGRFG
jgi:hypothetical protein